MSVRQILGAELLCMLWKGDGEEAVLAEKTDKTGESIKLLIDSYINSDQKRAQGDPQSTLHLKAG